MKARITKNGLVVEYDSQEESLAMDYFIKNTRSIKNDTGGCLVTNDVPIIFTRFESLTKEEPGWGTLRGSDKSNHRICACCCRR